MLRARTPCISSLALAVAITGTSLVACGGDELPQVDDGTLLTPYLAIADTLAADQVDPLSDLGAKVIAAAGPKQGQPGVAAIIEGAGGIGAQDLQSSRTAFKKLSDGMIEYLAAHPSDRSGLTLVHCPMTFSGKGALWVQKEGKVMNPYEGARMLHCGDKLGWDAELPKS